MADSIPVLDLAQLRAGAPGALEKLGEELRHAFTEVGFYFVRNHGIPQALLDAVVDAAVEQERLEAWIMEEVGKGVALPGLYPPNAETKARYEATRKG